MKKQLLLIIAFTIAFAGKSQITVTSADLANANDSVLISINNTFTASTYTIVGANQTWDFSNLSSQSQRYEKFDAPSTFPSIYALIFNAFITSYGKENRQLTSLPIPGITLSAAYDFFKKSNTQLKQIGSGYIIKKEEKRTAKLAVERLPQLPISFQQAIFEVTGPPITPWFSSVFRALDTPRP